MRFLRAIRNHPAVLLVAVLAGFGGWIASDLAPRTATPRLESTDSGVAPPKLTRILPTRMGDMSRPNVITADMVPKLQPGMTRVDVEELIGPPPAAMVFPVSNVDGRMTYRASYLANLDSTPTPPPGALFPVPTPRTVIGLEYDATRPGHPLLRVHLPDPMS